MHGTRVLTLSTVFPNPAEESLGPFIRNRLRSVAKSLDVQVVAPVALIDYANRALMKPGIPACREDGPLRVHHPRWLYVPGGGCASPLCLTARLIPFLARLRGQYKFDVIDSHFAYPDGITAAMLAPVFRRPFTVTLRGNETMHAESPVKGKWIRWALRRANAIITVSESLRLFAISMGVDPARVRTIPNGVDSDVFHPLPCIEARIRLAIPADRPVIVSAGALIERKGHHRVIRALSELSRTGSNAELWIVGGPGREGQFERYLHNEVQERGLESRVHFTGNVKPARMAQFMSAADVVCLASSREGWPNVVHEAQACGTPVVATAVGGAQEMIPGPEYGFVVPANDQDSLTGALRKAVETSWDRALIAAHGQARSWEQVGVETAEVLNCAAG
jgi:teichuronic acid biosynthesis glycosyltransferase TuaC